jgi:ribonuclease D
MQGHLYRDYLTLLVQITEKPAVLLVDILENLQEENLVEI